MKVDCSIAEAVDYSMVDVVILHYSIVISSGAYIRQNLREKLTDFRGLKIVFIQDEYRWIDRTAEAMRDIGVHVVFSVIDPQTVRKVYHHPWFAGTRFEYTLTGFVPDHLAQRPVPSYADRPLDVGYRARKLPAWYGRHALQKWQIAEAFSADAARYGLKVDISTRETDRIYGDAWIDFVASCRAVLGTESGASVCDFTGEIQQKVEQHLLHDPDATFEQLRDLYFADVDERIVIRAISPRCFEAAALRTLLIMYPGRYSDILEPGRHYVPLNTDHSNMDEVVEVLRSPKRAKEIIDTAFEEIILSRRWSHEALCAQLDRVISEEAGPPVGRPMSKRHIDRIEKKMRAAVRRENLKVSLAMFAARAEGAVLDASRRYLPQPLQRLAARTMRFSHELARRLAKRLLVKG
ncbi:MAG: hypothetical protein Kow0032_05450 [Methyloligellaceae bacterium]